MNTNTVKHSDIENFWHATFLRCEKSGLKIRAFCREKNIRLGQYMYWRKKLILQANKNNIKAEETCSLAETKTSIKVEKLKEIKVYTPPIMPPATDISQKAEQQHIKVIFPNEIEVKIPTSLYKEQIISVLTQVGGISC